MKRERLIPAVLVIGTLLLVSAPVRAHHGDTALYDMSREVTLKATIDEFAWVNPHCTIGFNATDGKHWVLETGSPSSIVNRGWSKATLKAGDHVTVTFNPGRKGNIGKLVKVVIPDGKEMK